MGDTHTQILFQWKNDADEVRETTVSIPNGEQGKSITGVEIDTDSHVIVTLSDGSTIDAGEIDTVDKLADDLVATVDIGTVTNGKKYPKGTKLETILRDILIKEVAPAVTLSLTPATALYDVVNETVPEIKLTAVVAKKTYPPTKVSFYADSVLLDEQIISDSGTYTYTYTPATPIKTKTVFKAVVTDGKLSSNSTKTINFVGKSYYGIVDATVGEPNETTIKSLNSVLKDVKGYVYKNIVIDYGKIVYAYPQDFNPLTSIKDVENNINYNESFARTAVTVDGIPYYCYTLIEATGSDGVDLTFA